MTNERDNTSKKPRIHLVKKTIAASTCLVSILSILLPFYHITYVYPVSLLGGSNGIVSMQFWSFKAQVDPGYYGIRHTYWLSNNIQHWDDSNPIPSLFGVLSIMIIAQILALGMAFLFFKKGRGAFAIAGVIFTIFTSYSMIRVSFDQTALGGPAKIAVNSYEIGFWLTCLSAILFLSSFIISHFSK